MKLFVMLIGIGANLCVLGQANLTAAGYTQNFGTSDITSWTNNSTFTGWYYANGSFQGHAAITTAAPSNNGGTYSYECNGDNNQKIGTRPSNSQPGAVGQSLKYGLILTNTSGQTIHSVNVSFTAYQFSLADNGDVVNTLDFHWAKGNPVNTDLVTGSYTAVPALTFTAPQSRSTNTNTGAQISGFPCTQSQQMSACIAITGGLPSGQQLVLRWSDINNSNNDPHLGIDNVQVIGFASGTSATNTCITALPVELGHFEVTCVGGAVSARWNTKSERENAYFSLQGSLDGINYYELKRATGNGNSNIPLEYRLDCDNKERMTYFRLAQVDYNGQATYYDAVYAECLSSSGKLVVAAVQDELQIHVPRDMKQELEIKIYSMDGKELYSGKRQMEEKEVISLPLSLIPLAGLYIVYVSDHSRAENVKFFAGR